MKICSLYGQGFYYIPGTDTCLKIGGFIRQEFDMNAGGSFAPDLNGAAGRFDRADTHDLVSRTRAAISFDTRTQTEYGTLRSYIRTGAQWSSGDQYSSTPTGASSSGAYSTAGSNVFFDRGFIQFAGFTAGRTQSFFDIFNPAPSMSLQTNYIGSATGGSGITVFGYTAQFGNGFSASISAEDRGGKSITNATSAAAFAVGSTPVNSQSGGNWSSQWPDLVGNLRIDQTWGSVGISGALHDVSASYYSGTVALPGSAAGHPGDEVGYAIGGGFTLNVPWWPGDQVGFEVDYSHGAGQYTNYTLTTGGAVGLFNGGTVGLGWNPDAVFTGTSAATGSGLQLVNNWALTAGYNHKWTPNLQTSLYGAYLKVDYNGTAAAAICTSVGGAVLTGVSAATGCTPNYSVWQIGSRTLWNPVANLDVGVDVMYNHINTAFSGATTAVANGSQPAGALVKDTDTVAGIFRVQRNFWP